MDSIRAALTLAAPALAMNPKELAPQLLARLAPTDAHGLHDFLIRLRRTLSPNLVPNRPSFTPPGAELLRLDGHKSVVTSVTVLANCRRAVSASSDSTLRLWDLETGAELRRFDGHGYGITSVAASGDGRLALSASYDSTLRLWDLESGAELSRLTLDAVPMRLAWSVEGPAVIVDSRGQVHVIDF